MHVPAYWPVLFGIQLIENSGVIVEVKKVIAMDDIGIMSLEDIDVEVELDIAMPDMVLDGLIVMDIDVDMSMIVGFEDAGVMLGCCKLVVEHYG